MKILKRNYGHRNLMAFLVLSLVYLQAIFSLTERSSFFKVANFSYFIENHYLIVGLTTITIYMVYKLKKHSAMMLLLCLITIVGKVFIILSHSFNKLSLGLNFLYLIFCFYFFISWELETELASFNPRFQENDLEKDTRFKLKGFISNNQPGEEPIAVSLTNIDEESCFLLIPEGINLRKTIPKTFYLELNLDGVVFRNCAKLVSAYDRGVGMSFLTDGAPDARLSWLELYKVCLERGFVS